MSSPIRVLVVDDDPLARETYRGFLRSHPDFELVGEARDGLEGVEAYSRLSPDVVLMDLQMPGKSGVEATREICLRWPGACVVALTTFGSNEYIVAALRAGAAGYLLKDATAKSLASSISQALAGEMPLASSVRRELVSAVIAGRDAIPAALPDPGLTDREKELLAWLARGLTNHQIGSRMYVSEGSVKQYLSRINDKLGVTSRTQVLVKAIQLGLIDPRQMDPL